MAVVRADADGDDKSILLTPYEVALVSELQVEAMRRCENLKRPFSFPTLIIAPRSSGGLATEAFEASELTVQMAAERVLESSGDQPTEADARVRTRDVFFPRPRFLRLFDCGGWSRPRSPESDGGVRGDGVLTSTTPPRAVVTVASTPLRHAGRRRRPRGREGHRRALPVPGRARRHPRHKSYLGVGLPPITKSQGQEARAGARGAFAGRVRQEGPDEEAPRHRCIGRGARHPRQGRRERCLRCGEAAADGPGRGFAGEGPGGRRGLACYRVGWVIDRSFSLSLLFSSFFPRRSSRVVVALGARALPLLQARHGGQSCACAQTEEWRELRADCAKCLYGVASGAGEKVRTPPTSLASRARRAAPPTGFLGADATPRNGSEIIRH